MTLRLVGAVVLAHGSTLKALPWCCWVCCSDWTFTEIIKAANIKAD
jgi:hypothetical protein